MTPTRHILIDNETLDVTPGAVLLTIAAVAVEISDGKAIVLGRWYRQIEWWPLYIAQPARTRSRSTIDWWNAQALEPFSEAFDLYSSRIPLHLAMQSLNAWLALNPYPIWGNGSDFDNAQLQHAFTQHGLRWPYWRNRCLRSLRGTALQLYPNTQLPDFPADKIKHHALHDAEHEADVLAVLLQTLAAPGSSSLPEDFARLYRSRRFGQILAIRQDDDDDTPQIAFHAQPDGLGVCQSVLSYDDSAPSPEAEAELIRTLGGSLWHIARRDLPAGDSHSTEKPLPQHRSDRTIHNCKDVIWLRHEARNSLSHLIWWEEYRAAQSSEAA